MDRLSVFFSHFSLSARIFLAERFVVRLAIMQLRRQDISTSSDVES